ncbi:hypothetical protein [Heyndrickxia coagulans]
MYTGGNPRGISVEEIEALYKSMLHDPSESLG